MARYSLYLLSFITVLFSMPAQAQELIEVSVYIEPDSLTIFVPGSQHVSLLGIGFETMIDGERHSFFLEDYDSFMPLRFESLPTPLCLRLERFNSSSPFPLACNDIPTLQQLLATPDVFWYDPTQRATRTLILVRRAEPLSICPAGEATCTLEYVQPTITPLPADFTPSLTPTRSPTTTPTAEPSVTTLPPPTNTLPPPPIGDCGNRLMWRLQVGGRGQVSLAQSDPSTLRSQPGAPNGIAYMQPGVTFIVLDGPRCTRSNGVSWWYVRAENGDTGWVSEGNFGEYWINPI
jgi:hypothetical protein